MMKAMKKSSKRDSGLKPTARRPVRPTRRKAARLGQHFLMHARIAERIALVADLSSEDIVVEIGPGTGMLTRELLKQAGRVVAIEADSELVRNLEMKFAREISSKRLTLVHADIRTWPTPGVGQKKYKVVANIPYYLTGEILRTFLSAKNQPSSMTLLVQKEVAERIVGRKKPYSAKATKGKESILSLSVKAYGEPKYEFTVPRGAFRPAPNVDSAVLTIRGISRKNFASEASEKIFFDILHAAFAHKRKYVSKNLVESGLLSREQLQKARIGEKARAEDLRLSSWLQLIADE